MKILILIIIVLINFAFLNPEHFLPWTTYDGEKNIFYTSVFFYLACILFFKEKIKLEINSILILVLLISSLFNCGDYLFKQNYYVFNLYLLNLFIFIVVLVNIFQTSKREQVFEAVLISLVICGIFSSIIAIFQWSGLFLNNFWIDVSNDSGRFSANLGQPNHLATLLLISLFSLLYFKKKYVLNDILVIVVIILIVFSLVLTQSRSVWSLFIFMLFIVLLKWKLVSYVLKLYISFIVLAYIAIMLIFRSINSGVELVSRVNSGFGRLAIWEDFYSISKYLNFWGSGWRNIEKFQWVYPSISHEYIFSYHNIVLDLIVIFGFLGVLVSLYFLRNIALIFIRIKNSDNLLIFLMLIVLVNHSFLEFPLFYSYFLFLFIFFYLYLCSVFFNNLRSIEFNRRYFFILFFLGYFLTFLYIREYEGNRVNYRAVSRGYCISLDRGSFLFDEFNESAFVNCVENISSENMIRFEKFLLNRPSPQNILKLIFVYNELGEYRKRDQLLLRYNKKYSPKYTLSEVLNKRIF